MNRKSCSSERLGGIIESIPRAEALYGFSVIITSIASPIIMALSDAPGAIELLFVVPIFLFIIGQFPVYLIAIPICVVVGRSRLHLDKDSSLHSVLAAYFLFPGVCIPISLVSSKFLSLFPAMPWWWYVLGIIPVLVLSFVAAIRVRLSTSRN